MWAFVYLYCPGETCSSGFQLGSYMIPFKVVSVYPLCWREEVPGPLDALRFHKPWDLESTLDFRVHNWEWNPFPITHKYNDVRVTFVKLTEAYPETNYAVFNFCSGTASKRNFDLKNIFIKMFYFFSVSWLLPIYSTYYLAGGIVAFFLYTGYQFISTFNVVCIPIWCLNNDWAEF